MIQTRVEVEGLRTLRRTLKRAGDDLGDLKSTHGQVAGLVERRASPRTPRRTGRLADSMRSSGTASAAIVRAGGASVPYAGPIHWGWPARGITAQPWIADAAGDSQDQWMQVYLQGLDHIINRVEGAPGP